MSYNSEFEDKYKYKYSKYKIKYLELKKTYDNIIGAGGGWKEVKCATLESEWKKQFSVSLTKNTVLFIFKNLEKKQQYKLHISYDPSKPTSFQKSRVEEHKDDGDISVTVVKNKDDISEVDIRFPKVFRTETYTAGIDSTNWTLLGSLGAPLMEWEGSHINSATFKFKLDKEKNLSCTTIKHFVK